MSYNPRPCDGVVKTQSNEDKLKDIERADEFDLIWPIVSNGPNADGNGENGEYEERHEADRPRGLAAAAV